MVCSEMCTLTPKAKDFVTMLAEAGKEVTLITMKRVQ